MRARIVVLAVAGLVPVFASAQGGMGGMGGMGGDRRGGRGGGRGGQMPERNAEVKLPAAKELEKFNPAALLIDKRKKLKLTDEQVTPIKSVESKIYERNGALLAQYDSVRQTIKVPSNSSNGQRDPNDSSMTVYRQQLQVVRGIVNQLIDRRTQDDADVLALVTDDQRKSAADLLDGQDKDFYKALPEFPRAREGGGRSGRGRPTQ